MNDSPIKIPETHAEVIGLWPSLGEFASDIAVPYETAKGMRRRNSIGAEHHPAVVAKATERAIANVTFELLTKLSPPRRARSAAVSSAQSGAGAP